MIYTDDSYIPTAPALQISGANDDLFHQLKKNSRVGAVPNSPLGYLNTLKRKMSPTKNCLSKKTSPTDAPNISLF
jgi:hypothetical protein